MLPTMGNSIRIPFMGGFLLYGLSFYAVALIFLWNIYTLLDGGGAI